jgi:hypothetical protein
MLGRSIVWFAVLVALILGLGQSAVPGWALAIIIVIALPLGIRASVKQKRLERQLVRAWWQVLIRGRAANR